MRFVSHVLAVSSGVSLGIGVGAYLSREWGPAHSSDVTLCTVAAVILNVLAIIAGLAGGGPQ